MCDLNHLDEAFSSESFKNERRKVIKEYVESDQTGRDKIRKESPHLKDFFDEVEKVYLKK